MADSRVEYQVELETLEASALDGLNLVNSALQRTMEAIEHQDVELAQIVVADDDRIDGRYLEVHQSLITLLATQSPVATDLRLISALLHVLKNVERMGDQCVNICKLIPLTGNEPPADEQMIKLILGMGSQARALINQAKRAFAERDVEMARDRSPSSSPGSFASSRTPRIRLPRAGAGLRSAPFGKIKGTA
jgi:phosphate transport system protein